MRPFTYVVLAVVVFLAVTFSITVFQSPYKAETLLASAYEEGLVVSVDPEKAAHWYRCAAERGDQVAQYKLGLMQYYGRGLEEDRPGALRWMARSAEQGYAAAQYFLGLSSDTGLDEPHDPVRAVSWYARAAEQGHSEAQQKLASFYWSGLGVEQSDQLAFNWASKAAAQDNAEAFVLLAKLYFSGRAVVADPKHAVELLGRAAELGNRQAEEMLGAAALEGRGMPKDVKAAIGWYSHAAEHGAPIAQYMLAMLYNESETPVDEGRVSHWLLQAAIQGHAIAQVTLASRLDNGQGIVRSKVKACALLRVALKKPLPDEVVPFMREQLGQEEATLTPLELAEVTRLEELYATGAGIGHLQEDLLRF